MNKSTLPSGGAIGRLCAILARLRGPGGCPWDREQTLATLKHCLLEECYELLDVMEGDDPENHAEELGDVLLQVLFQAQIRAEQGLFDLEDVARRLGDKLVRRHPHVFGDVKVDGSDDVLRNWEKIKQGEGKTGGTQDVPRPALSGIPAAMPALLRAQRVQAKASRSGFDWDDERGPRSKIAEETAELDAAIADGDAAAMTAEMGDLLFSVVNLCRFLKIDAEEALRQSTLRFARRFSYVERRLHEEGRDMRACTPQELDVLWEEAKR